MKHFCSFSEAIRAGLKLRPNQAFSRFFSDADNSTCAMGAALEAFIERPLTSADCTEQGIRQIVLDAAIHIHHRYIKYEAEAPCGCAEPKGMIDYKTHAIISAPTIENLIVHLNNEHKWTREQIADWLEREEEKLGFITLVESESSSESLQTVLSV